MKLLTHALTNTPNSWYYETLHCSPDRITARKQGTARWRLSDFKQIAKALSDDLLSVHWYDVQKVLDPSWLPMSKKLPQMNESPGAPWVYVDEWQSIRDESRELFAYYKDQADEN